MCSSKFFNYLLVIALLLLYQHATAEDSQDGFHGDERDTLLALKEGFNNSFLDGNWTGIQCYMNSTPNWYGIRCINGRVTGVSLENMGLVGKIKPDALVNLAELSILSFKNNSIHGNLMEFSYNPKLKKIYLSGNRFDGEIPSSLLGLNFLESLQLQENNLAGSIPGFNQSSLREFNVSYNNLSGKIPDTRILQSIGLSSFVGNQDLCGAPTPTACSSLNDSSDPPNSNKKNPFFSSTLVVVDVIVLVVLLIFFIIYYKKYKNLKKRMKRRNSVQVDEEKRDAITNNSMENSVPAGEEDRGKLVFFDKNGTHFELEDLLKASAEGLGKGNFGNCYKAMLEIGPAVVVKRLRDLKPLSSDEFVKYVHAIADKKHPNLFPPLAYYYSKDEKLLLYKYASNGNLYNRIHGERGTRDRVQFGWRSRLSVARGIARALEYLHLTIRSQTIAPHGNVKSSNVLLDENDEVLVTDYGLISLIALPIAAQRMVSYKSPEYQGFKKVSKKSDVWSYGCLLLELLTGRIATHSAPQEANGLDLCSWVNRAVREEWTAEIFDVEIAAQRSANHGMVRLMQIAMKCCEKSPEKRPEMAEVLREVEAIKVVVDSEDEEDLSLDQSITDDSLSASTPSMLIADERR
ncbi:putative inactive receptor kinase [Abeliophyllum distichum]|uniref:Inactive receptor kinase n=1 Tax=Abeliophyllum distichum TaxID=126358 RepID=A0ABD1TGN2_9LAMI